MPAKISFIEDLRQRSNDQTQRRRVREEADRLVRKHIAAAKERALANADFGMTSVAYECEPPMVSGRMISEETLVNEIVMGLRDEGLEVSAEVRERYRTNIMGLFVRLSW